MLSHETLLSHLPGDSDNERLEVVFCKRSGQPTLLVRRQTFGAGVGWYTQSTVDLSMNQLSGLQQSLCLAKSLGACSPASSCVESGSDDDGPVLIPFPAPRSA